MPKVTIYHNPRCSKSREALQFLQAKNIEPEIVLYLESPPSVKELTTLLKKLKMKAHELVRRKEPLYKDLKLDKKELTETELVNLMCKHPVLIERPIIIKEQKAVVARPTEKIKEIL